MKNKFVDGNPTKRSCPFHGVNNNDLGPVKILKNIKFKKK